MTYDDNWKYSAPRNFEPEEFPCKWEHMSGICMICGNLPEEGCQWELEQVRAQRR